MSDNAIKSVRRVFEILELFDAERRPLPAKEISRQLGYPLTSSHALLKSMQELGYADFDAADWSYTPSRRFPLLLDWVRDQLDREADLLAFVAALNRETKETVNLSRRINDQVRIIYGLEGLHTVSISVKAGALMPVTGSLTGITSLADLDAAAVDEFCDTLVTLDAEQSVHLNRPLVDRVLTEVRRHGTVSQSDLLMPGIGAVCMPVRTSLTKELLVIGVVGPGDRIAEFEANHRRTLKRLAAEYSIDTVFKLSTPRS